MESSVRDQDKVKEEFRKQIKELEKQIEDSHVIEKKLQMTITDRDTLISTLRKEIEESEKKFNE
jgi:chromosome segregation ATPase